MLTGEPTALSILDIINAVDPIPRIHECPLGNKAHGKNLCALHRTIDEAFARAEETFRSVTIDTLLDVPAAAAPTCTFTRSCPGGSCGKGGCDGK